MIDLQSSTHDFWLVCLKDRQRLPFYRLSREDQRRITYDWQLKELLLSSVDEMPARLAERVIMESHAW